MRTKISKLRSSQTRLLGFTSFRLVSLRLVLILTSILLPARVFAQSSFGGGNGIGGPPIIAGGSGCSTSGTALLKGNGSGGCSNASSGSDYAPPTSGNAILKGNGAGGFSNAASGTDYAPATSSTAILKGNGAGGFSNTASGTDYAPATSGNAMLKGNNGGGFANAVQNTDYFGGEIQICNITGTSAGSFTCYQHQLGHYKRTTCYLNGYENTSATPQTCSLTANGGLAFSSSGSITSNISPFAATLGGSPPNSITLPSSMITPESGVLLVEGQ